MAEGQWITPPQAHRIGARASEAVFGKRILADHAQLVLSDAAAGQEFGEELATLVTRLGVKYAPKTEVFADEITVTERGYPAAYVPKPVPVQLALLQPVYPTLDASHVEELIGRSALSRGLELWQLWPKLTALGRLLKLTDPFGVDYPVLVKAALQIYARVLETAERPFANYIAEWIVAKNFRLLALVRERLMAFESVTPGDFNVTPMQSGLLFRGRSDRRGRWEIEQAKQLPLPTLLGAYHLITNPERLADGSELVLDCVGDEVRIEDEREFLHAPYFYGNGGQVLLVDCYVGSHYGNSAPGSFVLPE